MNPQINLIHLLYFCDAVNNGSISEAAKINYVSQSAVSQAIQKLELSLKVKLIEHQRQKFQLTEEGAIVFEEARPIFKSLQNMTDKIHEHRSVISGNVKFVSTNSLGMSFIPPTYKKTLANLPEIKLSYSLGGLSFIRTALKTANADFAIVVYDENFADFQKYSLKKGQFGLYQHVDATHHLIENGILVDMNAGMHVQSLLEALPLKINLELAGWEVVARFTEMNIGVGFFPDYIHANDRYKALKKLKTPTFDYEICAIYNKGEKLSRAAKAFLEQFTVAP